jgi:predicted glycogen debranching enzyme
VALRIGPETCRNLESALTREWLVTNGLGGFASGTVAGVNTRRYHGLLVASMNPPVQRMVLLAALEEWLLAPGGEPVPLATHEYWDGTVYPEGFTHLDGLELEGTLPVFRWTAAGRTIEKRIWMEHETNRSVISYRLVSGPSVTLQLRPLFAHRDYHEQRHGQGGFDMAETGDGWIIDAAGVRSYLEVRPMPVIRSHPDWYWRVLHRVDRERGLDAEEDLFTPGVLEVPLSERATVTVVTGTEPVPPGWDAAASLQAAAEQQAAAEDPGADNSLACQLVRAAAQFRVARRTPGTQPRSPQRTVIAGYHWFTDWGRDTMISLPGLAMRPGMLWEARAVLDTNIHYLDQGLIPNRFPDSGQPPEYDTMDATLWMFQALCAYLRVSGDWRFIADRLDALQGIIDWHVRGTRHNIRMDPQDGLLTGGEDGYALTWMDARVQDWAVTPRRGKPIEINALWYNALRLIAEWSERATGSGQHFAQMATQARESARLRFWYARGGYCYDVVDGPAGDDPSLRPNQVIAMSLAYPLIEGDQARSALDAVSAKLLTPYGLRTLGPEDERYQPDYRGAQRARDAAYHQGLVWPWLLGPYLDAHLRIHGDREVVGRMLEPFRAHLAEAGLGTISEIFEAEPPFRPVGCIAQAWSVAEILRHALTPK